jgi:N-terminal acetyltransferase B complex non-catalytic subunit
MASKKEIPNINESMPLMDKNDENNELAELNKPLILTKEYNSQKELIKKYENEIKEFKNLHQGYNEKIKEEITEELYNFLDKKIKKNTLKLIVDQQLEIKKFQKKNNYLNENKKILEARNGNLSSNLLKIAKLEKSLKSGKEEFAKQKLLEDRISLFEKRITDTEKEIETQSLLKNKITKLEKDFVGAKVETRANEVTDTEKLHQIKEIKVENNLKKDLTNVRQETLKINDVIKDQEQQLKLLYEEKIELNQNTLDFQKNKNQLKSEFIHKQQELIKKYEKEMKEFKNLNQEYNEKIISLENANSDLKNLNQEYNEKIISLEKANSDLKNKEDEIKHYQNDNLRLANQLFETSKKLENTKAQINKFESDKSQIQEQIHNLNEIISKNNIAKDQIIQFAQNKDTENISKISIEEKPDIELDISSQDLEEKNKDLEEVNEKTKNIFAN